MPNTKKNSVQQQQRKQKKNSTHITQCSSQPVSLCEKTDQI